MTKLLKLLTVLCLCKKIFLPFKSIHWSIYLFMENKAFFIYLTCRWEEDCNVTGTSAWRVSEAGIHQAPPLPGGPSARGRQLTDALRANHRKVMTVPFLPICQGSRGKNRIIILQETEKKKKDVISSLANASYSKTPSQALPPWVPWPACLSLAGILEACFISLMISPCRPVRSRMVAVPGQTLDAAALMVTACSVSSEGQPAFKLQAPWGHVQCPRHLCFLKA